LGLKDSPVPSLPQLGELLGLREKHGLEKVNKKCRKERERGTEGGREGEPQEEKVWGL